ncbi:MAG: serine/threonine-protein phosphatase [Candidatus Eisenbacteria bacterium]|nr:serine/threonine-protein phosphatase [Candidatus Eisenbacteria bacterium]
MRVEWAFGTDPGRVRTNNEDSVLALPEKGLAILCDGMGGHRAGETASQIAVETFIAAFEEGRASAAQPGTDSDPLQAMITAAREANRAVNAKARAETDFYGMGCTLVALHLGEGEARFVTVGDSRLYLFRDGELHQVSEDHTRLRMLEQMGIDLDPAEARQVHGILIRAIGTQSEIDVDYGSGPAVRGDIWLLCSDGLTDELKAEEIRVILSDGIDAEQIVAACIRRALDAGGRDNVSVVAGRVIEGPLPRGGEAAPRVATDSASDTAGAAAAGHASSSLLRRLSRRLLGRDPGVEEEGSR